MDAQKLQAEIDRTLKNVTAGVELFTKIYAEIQSSTSHIKKEKAEQDLRTQIAKLQRLRDQIKTWVAINAVEDKSALLASRRLIEAQMEKFKARERETRPKAFDSREPGLIAFQWVTHQVDELRRQMEASGAAEIQGLQVANDKKQNDRGQSSLNTGRQEESGVRRLNERREWHITRLEIVLRMLKNGSMSLEKLDDLKEDITYFVECNAEEDFDEDEGLYDELNLDLTLGEEEERPGSGLGADDGDESEERKVGVI